MIPLLARPPTEEVVVKSRPVMLGISALAVLALGLAACGKSATPSTSGSPRAAAACTADRLKGVSALALRAGASHMKLVASKHVAQAAKPVVKIGMFGDLTGSNSGLVIP